MRLVVAIPCLLGLVLSVPVGAQPSAPLYDADRKGGGSVADAAQLAAVARGVVDQEARLVASDGESDGRFGDAVSLWGDRALLGAPNHEDGRGAAYVFVRSGSTWTQEAKLIADDRAEGDIFGLAVSLSSDRALVGAAWDDDLGSYSGAAYVFVRSGSTWTQEAKLTADDGAQDDEFGEAVSLSGDRALIGAGHDDEAGSNSGSAYVFVRSGSTWAQEAKIAPDDGGTGDRFGSTVSLSGDRALFGVPSDDDLGSNSGAAYVFVRSGSAWSQEAKLTAADGAEAHSFGNGVSLSEDHALILAPGSDDRAAYVFARSGGAWMQEDRLVAPAGADYTGFSGDVSLFGDYVLLATFGGTEDSAVIFARSGSTWAEETMLTVDGGTFGLGFGSSLSLYGDRALVGAFYEDGTVPASGAAYVFAGIGPVANEPGAEVPSGFALAAAYPNPFNTTTVLTLGVLEAGRVTVVVYDLLGREVALLHDGPLGAGEHALTLDAAALPSGVYLVRAAAGAEVTAQRVTVVR